MCSRALVSRARLLPRRSFRYPHGMTLQSRSHLVASTLPLALALLAACGDDGVDTVTGTATGTGTGTATGTTGTSSPSSPTDPTGPGTATEQPTDGSASESISGTGTTTGPTTSASGTGTGTATDTTESSASSTTMPVQTDTGTTEESGTTTTTGDTTTSTTTGTTTTGEDTSSGGDDTTDGVVPCECPDIEVPLDDGIFVLSDNSELFKFFPETNQFVNLGAFNCGGMTNTFSMAVDRLGFAWVMFNTPQGEIWKLDVTDVSNCIDPGYNQGQQAVNYFGMAYVSKNQNDQCDQLYGNTFDGFGGFSEGPNIGDFITVDPDTLILSKLGKTNFNGAELTGTGDGRAFMFGGANPAKLVQVDKSNGAFLEVTPLGTLELTNAFAFAFFAGDFYMFTESDKNPLLSKVTHYDYDDSDNNGIKDLTTVVMTAPIRIVGAGVSTCAPFVPM